MPLLIEKKKRKKERKAGRTKIQRSKKSTGKEQRQKYKSRCIQTTLLGYFIPSIFQDKQVVKYIVYKFHCNQEQTGWKQIQEI